MNAKMRAWWFEKQGLSGMAGSVSDVLSRSGWARTVGGANPYLTAFSRTGASMEDVHKAVEKLQVHELPSARGCTYMIPREDFAIALKVGQGTSEVAAVRTATKYLGVTEEELETLDAAVLSALARGPLDPKQLRDSMGGVVRSLGDEGKKRGQSTTLPLALGRLQTEGKIRRILIGERLDKERFAYALWPDNPLKDFAMDKDQAFMALAKKFWKWIGPARAADFQWFSAQGVGATSKLIEPLGLESVGDDFLILPEEREAYERFEVPEEPRYALVANLDAIILLRRDAGALVEEVDKTQTMYSEKRGVSLGSQDISHHAILDRGRLVGLWEYDPEARELVHRVFVPKTAELMDAVEKVEVYIQRQLGDFRSFSLDSPASRRSAIDFLRSSG